MKIKVVYIIDGLKNGGKERQLIEIAKFLPKDIFYLLIVSFGKQEHYEQEAIKLSNQYFYINKQNNKLRPFFALRKILKNYKPDIIHSWDSFSSFYTYCCSKFSTIKFIDGSIRDAGIEKGFKYKLKCHILKKADLVIANSKAGLDYYKVNGQIIYNIVNQKRFIPNRTNNEFNIIKASTFSDYKDHNTFIKASILLLNNNIVDNVYLAGDGKYKSYYQNMIKDSEEKISSKFHFIGAIHNIEEYISKCQVGVLCSTKKYGEGLSNSLLEYMASGLIPVATKIGGSLEIINNKNNGFLFEPGNYNELIDIIIKIKANIRLKNKIRKNALLTIEKKFNHEQNMRQLIENYKKLVI